jgi:hypothetical protein
VIEFHVYVSVPGSQEKVRQLERFFSRLPDQHLRVLYPIFVMERKPGGLAGGGTWPPGAAIEGEVMGAARSRNTGVPDADIERWVVSRRTGLIGLSKDRWERPLGRLEFSVFHEVGHCVDVSLRSGLVPSGATEADFAGMETDRCGQGSLMVRRAVEAYARYICLGGSRVYHFLPPSETQQHANQRLINALRRSDAFRSVPATWRPLV